ncbi:MAG TPA: hypothetical protein ENI45_04340 [Thermoplasmatales archaeon]|nr:hypothetical protein [Thermoplasmatales archaeon]
MVPPGAGKKKRHRYIGFIIVNTEKKLSRREVNSAIKQAFFTLFKENKPEHFGVKLVRFNGKEGMLQCFHKHKEDVIWLLQSINKINGENVKLKTVGTSGTIRSLNKKFFDGRLKR